MNTIPILNKIFLLIPLLALASGQPVQSSECESVPDYWFSEGIVVEEVPLPAGIQVSALESLHEPRAALIIHNETGENLFVLSLRYRAQLTGDATRDPAYDARLRYAHEVASYLVPAEGVRLLTLDMSALADLDPDLQDRNRLDETRPEDGQVEIPATGYSALLLVHGMDVYQVPFGMTYHLNPDFSPIACPDQIAQADASPGEVQTDAKKMVADLERGLLGPALLVLVVAVSLLTYLIVRYVRKP
jgi:hypothetical protein